MCNALPLDQSCRKHLPPFSRDALEERTRKNEGLDDLKANYGHELDTLWQAIKEGHPDDGLDRFRPVDRELIGASAFLVAPLASLTLTKSRDTNFTNFRSWDR